MTGNNSVVQDLFGISDCDLVSSQTVVENGKRCQASFKLTPENEPTP